MDEAKLRETNVEERKALSQKRKLSIKTFRKATARGFVAGLDNLDSVFGIFQQICLLLVAEFIRRGEWLNVAFFTSGIVIFYLLKIRMPEGTATRFFKSETDKIKARLIDISQTIIK